MNEAAVGEKLSEAHMDKEPQEKAQSGQHSLLPECGISVKSTGASGLPGTDRLGSPGGTGQGLAAA